MLSLATKDHDHAIVQRGTEIRRWLCADGWTGIVAGPVDPSQAAGELGRLLGSRQFADLVPDPASRHAVVASIVSYPGYSAVRDQLLAVERLAEANVYDVLRKRPAEMDAPLTREAVDWCRLFIHPPRRAALFFRVLSRLAAWERDGAVQVRSRWFASRDRDRVRGVSAHHQDYRWLMDLLRQTLLGEVLEAHVPSVRATIYKVRPDYAPLLTRGDIAEYPDPVRRASRRW